MEKDITALRQALWVSALASAARRQPACIDEGLSAEAERVLRRSFLARVVLSGASLPS